MTSPVLAPGREGAPALSRPGPGQRRPRLRLPVRRAAELWLFLVPAVAFFGVLFLYPLGLGGYMSTTNYGTATFITGQAPFVGLANFTDVLRAGLITQAITNTLIITGVSIVAELVLGLALALMFNRRFPGVRWLPTLLLIPWLIPSVVTATIWKWLLQGDGAVNQVLGAAGLPTTAWLANPATALGAVILVCVWGSLPFWTTILGAALKQVPREEVEAAQVDGAGARARLFHIIIPRVWPVISVLVILSVIYTLKIVDIVLVLTQGGPADATVTLGLLSYRESFNLFNFGTASAYGIVLLAFSVVVALAYTWLTRRQERRLTR